MLTIMLAVVFTMCVFLWLLVLLGVQPDTTQRYAPWLAWFSVIVLGLLMFLTGTGVIVWRPGP